MGSTRFIKKKADLSIASGSSSGSQGGKNEDKHRRVKGKLVPLSYNINNKNSKANVSARRGG